MQSKILKLGMRSNAATATQSADLLERAAIENKPEVIVELVEKGTDVNKRLANDWTALHIGSAHNYSNLVGRLLEQNADPELSLPDGSTALHISALNGHHQVVEVLLNHGAKPDTKREHDGLTPLHLAAAKSRKQALQLLLEAQEKYGMDIDQPAKNGATVLECACQSSSLECIEMIVSAGADVDAIVDLQGRTPLMITATTDNYQVAEILLNAGAEIDHVHEHNGIPAVTVAVFSGSLKVLETLISRGANLDLMGKNGYAPLRAAITGSNSEAAMMLLRSRVKVNTQYDDHQVTALHLAASRSLYNVVGSIIKMGADLKALDKDGDPPLQWAVHRGDPKMCEILLSHGAEVNRKNEKTGEVVLHWAVRAGHIMVTEFLLANGANALFVDLTQIKKSEDADEEDFEICKALLETAPDTSDQPDGKRPGSPTLPNPEVKGSDNLLQGENVNVKTPIGDSTEVVPSADQKDLPPQIESSKISNSFPKNDDESTVEPSLDASSRSELQFLLPNGTTLKSSVEKSKSEARQHLRILESDIRFSIYRAREEAAESIFLKLGNALYHTGVTCDGPLCTDKKIYIQGIRFKCTYCENTDFCLACVSSFHNNHHAGHPMIRCLLPTDFQLIKEIDADSKRQVIEASGESSTTVEDVIHIVYGVIDMEDLKSQATSVSTHSIEPAELDELLDDLAPVFFPVIRPTPGHAPDIRKPGIIRDEIDKPEGVHSYKIDEVGNVRVKQYHKDVDLKTTPRENDVLLHHQDPDLMLKVIMGQLQHYHYEQDRQFHQWATEGRLVTRLIDIEPGDLDDKMRIAIRIVDLKQSPHYKALSYTWKETAYERAIQPQWSPDDVEAARKMARVLHAVYCDDPSGNERFLEINCGLRDALRRFRHKSETRTYWVDQISINQSNPSERAYQVSGMQFFFNRASEVTLCIGEEEKDTSEVFAVLETIAKEFKRLGFPPNPDQIVANPQSNLPPFESHVWVSVLNLFDRPVFNRCWVIQEVVTAQKLILYCGSFCIEWADLSKVGQTLCQKSWYPRLPQGRLRNKYTGLITSSSDPQPQGIEMPGFNTVVVMNDLRDQFHTLKRNPLESLLYTTFTFEASDPRDKVYSLLGVRSARISSSDPHWIKADYEKSVNEVFLNAAKVCILESSSFAICGINNGPSSRSIDELPSWVPDLTAKGIDHLTSFCRPHPSSPYSACGDIPIITAWPYEEHPDLLVTSSCKIETIASVSEHFFEDMESFSNLIMEWSSMASRIGPRYPTGEFTPDAFRRTCVADVTGPYRYGPMPERLNIPFIKLIERFFYHHISVEVDRGEKTLDDILSESWNPVITDLMTDLFRMEDALKSIEEDSNEGSSADDVTAGIANRFGMPSSPIDSALLEDIVLA